MHQHYDGSGWIPTIDRVSARERVQIRRIPIPHWVRRHPARALGVVPPFPHVVLAGEGVGEGLGLEAGGQEGEGDDFVEGAGAVAAGEYGGEPVGEGSERLADSDREGGAGEDREYPASTRTEGRSSNRRRTREAGSGPVGGWEKRDIGRPGLGSQGARGPGP